MCHPDAPASEWHICRSKGPEQREGWPQRSGGQGCRLCRPHVGEDASASFPTCVTPLLCPFVAYETGLQQYQSHRVEAYGITGSVKGHGNSFSGSFHGP